MERRALLVNVCVLTAAVAGCSSGLDESDDVESDDGGDDDVAYGRCGAQLVDLSSLPEPAEAEAMAALEDGTYETDGDVLLPAVIDVDADTRLVRDDTYYDVTVEDVDGLTRVRLEETEPPTSGPASIRNLAEETGATATVDVRIEYEDEEVLVDEAVELDVSESVEFDDVAFPYGTYRADLDVELDVGNDASIEDDTLSETVEWTVNRDLGQVELEIYDYPELEVNPAQEHRHPSRCAWNDDGELVEGPDA